ncbi:MFS transporter (plasmid) [Embleya sp. NBC_00888]|uniref:MFS transporter n=1 Tax=Embleya sp. NBC_00888 TaxID=2975960 RepID=UPI00386D494A|nr:MFS transporter [Embleya sp. NBC_00888]
MVATIVTACGAMTSFYLLLSVVPLYVARAADGTNSGVGAAGLVTGALMASTVAAELAVPALLARFGYRAVFALGLLLLGVPTMALAVSSTLPLVVGVCLLRGGGLGILMVVGTALAAESVPPERRGEGLGLYGAAVGVPAILGLPLGLWMSEHLGFTAVFALSTACALGALGSAIALPTNRPAASTDRGGVLAGLRTGALARPAVVFAACTFAAGVILTFLPLAVSSNRLSLVTLALLTQSGTTPAARWWAGWYGDRHGHARLFAPSIAATALGTALLARSDEPVTVLIGAALFGAGFGTAQNVTQSLMFERVAPHEFGRVSALWNLAFDAGMGIGAVGFGALIGGAGYPAGFLGTAALVLAGLVLVAVDRRGADADTRPSRTAHPPA